MLLESKLFFFYFPNIWQIFPDEQLKITRKKTEFDTKQKKIFIDYSAQSVNCNRLICPADLSVRPALQANIDSFLVMVVFFFAFL